jgi:hypothetical protein
MIGNLRLIAIRSFLRFNDYEMPAHGASIQCILPMPTKRFDRKVTNFPTRPEVDASFAAPNMTTLSGRQDHAQFESIETNQNYLEANLAAIAKIFARTIPFCRWSHHEIFGIVPWSGVNAAAACRTD